MKKLALPFLFLSALALSMTAGCPGPDGNDGNGGNGANGENGNGETADAGNGGNGGGGDDGGSTNGGGGQDGGTGGGDDAGGGNGGGNAGMGLWISGGLFGGDVQWVDLDANTVITVGTIAQGGGVVTSADASLAAFFLGNGNFHTFGNDGTDYGLREDAGNPIGFSANDQVLYRVNDGSGDPAGADIWASDADGSNAAILFDHGMWGLLAMSADRQWLVQSETVGGSSDISVYNTSTGGAAVATLNIPFEVTIQPIFTGNGALALVGPNKVWVTDENLSSPAEVDLVDDVDRMYGAWGPGSLVLGESAGTPEDFLALDTTTGTGTMVTSLNDTLAVTAGAPAALQSSKDGLHFAYKKAGQLHIIPWDGDTPQSFDVEAFDVVGW
jgi:hypothetical protein